MRKFAYLSFAILSSGLFFKGNAQISYGGQPEHWGNKETSAFPVSFVRLPGIDRAALAAEDAVTDKYKETPYRFGVAHETVLDFFEEAEMKESKYGTRIFRMGIQCPEAVSVSFTFEPFYLPEGGRVFVYSADRSQFIGSFDHRLNNDFNLLAVGLIHTDAIVIEYQQDASCAETAQLGISEIVHGYRPILNKWEVDENEPSGTDRGPFGNSGACNINVNCPEGSAWQTQKRAVALIVSSNFALCTGALVNNNLNDGTPYFLTANHCGTNPTNWVFYFNHESSSCSGNTGPTNQSISGAVNIAANAGSDFKLIRLGTQAQPANIPASFNVFYAGWDATDETSATSAVGIHHPSGDVKKICFENNAPFKSNQMGAAVWFINQWELGVTEGGSSGSPLFNNQKRIIGQLLGGSAACAGTVNNGMDDFYGRFGVSWNGNSPTARLRDWLDPNNSGILINNGFPAELTAVNDVSAGSINGISASVCGSTVQPTVTIMNQGSATLTSATINYTLNGNPGSPIPWTGNVAQYATANVNLPILNLVNGNNTLSVTVSNPNGQTDEVASNNSASQTFVAVTEPTLNYVLSLTLDDYGSETTWTVKTSPGGQTIYTGGPYSDGTNGQVVTQVMCLPDGCYTFTINDSWGDGICCQYGQGSYNILNNSGVSVATGGQFTTSVSHNFCVTVTEVEILTSHESLKIFPVPAGEILYVEKNMSEPLNLRILSTTGQVVHAEKLPSGAGLIQLSVGSWAKGVYFAEFKGNGGRVVKRIVVD
jgi:lysyl endopeptidase